MGIDKGAGRHRLRIDLKAIQIKMGKVMKRSYIIEAL
jgi:hypothetical protein